MPKEPPTRPDPLPRLLLLDMTRIGGGTATGEIKRNLLAAWPPSGILQVRALREQLEVRRDGAPLPGLLDEDAVVREVLAFDPEVILYRPTADRPGHHQAAMRIIAKSQAPLALWIMDDWMARLEASDPGSAVGMDRDLRWLIARAGLRLSISPAMSDMLARRYGGEWLPFANGVAPREWPERRREAEPDVVILRYAGGLASDMTLDSLVDVAEAVQALSDTHAVRLEINSRPQWVAQAGHRFEGFTAVRVTSEIMRPGAYRRWLSEADISVIPYNFDPETARYVQYSLANKTPECMASGAAILAYGPTAIHTIALLKDYGCAEVVSERDPGALRAAIRRLVEDGEHRRILAAHARRLAFERHDLATTRRALEGVLRGIATSVS
ncbi:glycosyltransferase [Brevundimonas sp.]|uniref:glycosyltransferase n=1 Tax=Brevundimonas sp. TaxID=1871086 RepID=UPI0025D9CE39|nr:glycosyltransferase [Brevundimonas sp.]